LPRVIFSGCLVNYCQVQLTSTLASLSDFGISDSEFNYSEDLWQEVDCLEFLPDEDDSVLLPGIEELEPLSDFTDIG